MGLAGILNDDKVMSPGYVQDRLHIGWLSIEMHRDDGFRFCRDGLF